MTIETLGAKLDRYIAAGEDIYGKGYYQKSIAEQEKLAAALGVGEDESTNEAIYRLIAERDRYREALQNTYDALKDPAFVRCTRCGWQESTSDLDVMSLYIKPALGIKE